MASKRIGSTSKRGSWARNCKIVMVERKGRDVLNPKSVRWFESFEEFNIEPSNGDFLYTVQLGDRIDRLAMKFYGSVQLWWVIAQANSIDEPAIGLHPGENIMIPSPSMVDLRVTGLSQSKMLGL